MAPFAPFDFKAMEDTVVRVPVWMMNRRPIFQKLKEKVGDK